MLIAHIRKLQEILTNVQRNSLSGEINFIFNQSGHNLPFTITSLKVVRANQEIDLYNILNVPTNEEYSKKFNNQVLSFKYIHYNNDQPNITFLMDSLKRNALIHQETKIGNFRSIFSGRPVEQKII